MEELKKEPVTACLILSNILVFLLVEITGGSQNTMHMLKCGAAYGPAILEGGEYYRLFTSMFLHFAGDRTTAGAGSRKTQVCADISSGRPWRECDFTVG